MPVIVEEKEKTEPPVSQEFSMPPVEPGETVAWYLGGHRVNGWVPGVVVQVAARVIKLMLLGEGRFMEPHTSVHHIADPQLKERPNLARTSGAWDYHPLTIKTQAKLRALSEQHSLTSRRLEEAFSLIEDLQTRPAPSKARG